MNILELYVKFSEEIATVLETFPVCTAPLSGQEHMDPLPQRILSFSISAALR